MAALSEKAIGTIVTGSVSAIGSVISGVGTMLSVAEKNITERRQILAVNIAQFMNMETGNSLHLLFPIFGIIAVIALIYMKKSKH